jgi:hypothetical protein
MRLLRVAYGRWVAYTAMNPITITIYAMSFTVMRARGRLRRAQLVL